MTINFPNEYKNRKIYLRDESVEVGVSWAFNVKRAPADIIDGFIVKKHGDIGVLKEGMGGKDTVVRLNNGSRDLW